MIDKITAYLDGMKKSHKMALKVLLVLVLIAILASIFSPAKADTYCVLCVVNGEKGDKGDRGPRGPRGLRGPRGYTGATGETGPQGEIGLAGADGRDGKDALNDEDYWTDDELDQMFAASTAMAGIDFDSTTSKLQLGAAVGGYGGEHQGAIGIAKVWDNDTMGDVLLSFKTTLQEVGRNENEKRPWVAAATWKIKLK